MTAVSSPRTIYAPDGAVDWHSESRNSAAGDVVRIIIGRPKGETAAIVELEPNRRLLHLVQDLPDLATLFPTLTHLYLWNLDALSALPSLPADLKCLDVRDCPALASVHDLPPALDTLVLDKCPSLVLEAHRHRTAFPQLRDLSLRGSTGIAESWALAVLKAARSLEKFDASGCIWRDHVDEWPDSLVDLRLDDCNQLIHIAHLPRQLRRLSVRGSSSLRSLPRFPTTLDCVILAGASSLKHPLEHLGSPRTLIIHGSGLDLPQELFGDDDQANVARKVFAYRAEVTRGSVQDDEVKVFLLGNGRCGKSSLARRLVDDIFDENEPSTHGIQLWSKESFPLDDAPAGRTARLNIWDFAGQDLYHNTHRLFLQHNAVHLLCWTNHGDGSRLKDDRPADHLAEGEDIRRNLRYWREQVESLGVGDAAPPMLAVRTKVDRDREKRSPILTPPAASDLVRLDVSAATGTGFEALAGALRSSSLRVLGAADRNRIGERPMAVKRAIQALKDQNDQALQHSRSSGPRATPPHPVMSRADFDALVRAHCTDGDYFESPRLLLDFLHQGGFVYTNERHLPNHVILDQRWAIDGIYTLFRRQQCWANLVEQRGRFTPSELAAWAWDAEGYSADEQRLFLEFMQACEICFQLVPADETRFCPKSRRRPESERQSAGQGAEATAYPQRYVEPMATPPCGLPLARSQAGFRTEPNQREAVYLAPAALPLTTDPRVGEQAADQRGDATPEERVVLGAESDVLSRDAVMQLLVHLGRQWRRTAVLWRWGGQFRSYSEGLWADKPTFVHLDWQEHDRDSYGGKLTLTRYGPDADFLAEVLDICRKLPAFARVAIPRVERQERDEVGGAQLLQRRAKESPSGAAEAPRGSSYSPTLDVAVGVEIGISFAGDAKDTERGAPCEVSALAPGSIERWPRELARRLRAAGFSVEDYRTEQDKPVHEREPSLKRALDRLTNRDFMVVFLSWKYLTSPICMYEFLRVRGRMKDGHDPTVLRLGAFPDGLCWADNRMESPGPSTLGKFRDHWATWRDRFWKQVRADLGRARAKDLEAAVAEASAYAFYEWVAFLRDASNMDALVRDLRERFQSVKLSPAPSSAELDAWCEEIASNTGRVEVLLKFAADRWRRAMNEGDPERQQEGRARALDLFEHAMRREVERRGAGDLDSLLAEPCPNPALDDMRRALRERL